ncbi:MAG: HAMP domain-containing protein [Deltaproteobacteria bacterium]|nr:HAMP domain-containing protein [Deltaproteobacteria bacterium]
MRNMLSNLLSNLNLKTKLLFMMVSLCFLSIVFLLILFAQAEKDLIDEVRRHTEDLSTAIQISIEQMSRANGKEAGEIEAFKGLAGFKKKGIRDISVVNSSRDVIASSNPRLIGKKLNVKGESFKNIGNVTEYTTTAGGRKVYDMLLPVVVGKELLGYIHIETQFEDFADIARGNHINRLAATLVIFSIGILAAMYLSRRYSEPIQSIADAAQRVASGDLSVRLEADRNDEIGRLTRNFNDMVGKLNENRELESRLKEAEHMSKIGTLASGIAHEVRNPLNLINLSIDHLRASYSPDDPGKREGFTATVAGIKSEIERLDGMVTNFLDFGRPLRLQLKRLQVEPVLDETFSLLFDSLSEQKITLKKEFAGSPCFVEADYRHLKTCFLNILINSIQAMPEGGSILVRAYSHDGAVSVAVEDTGCGVGPENIRKVFDPYFTTKETGIGIGLALTKRVVEEHGGTISITSVVDSGTTVTVDLPQSAEV